MNEKNNNPDEMPDFHTLMQQAQQMQDELWRTKNHLGQKAVEASAGGGMVSVVVSGHRELLQISIDPQVIDPKDPHMLQDLILAAVNQGLQKAQRLEEEEMQKAASQLGLPTSMF